MADEELCQIVSCNIRARMNEIGTTQRAAAKVVGISLSSFNAYLTGRRAPSLGAAVKLARGLKISLDELVT